MTSQTLLKNATKTLIYLLLSSYLLGCSLTSKALKTNVDSPLTIEQNTPGKAQPLTLPTFQSLIAKQRLVYAAERHTSYTDHQMQLYLAKLMHQQSLASNTPFAIGLEWFQTPFQPYLDQYINQQIDEDTFLRKTDYYNRWGYDYRLMRPLINYAKQHRIKLIALNADVTLTRKVGKKGLASLSPNERQQLPTTVMPPAPAYRDKLKTIFQHHSKDPALLANFIMVQRLWDQSMANQAIKYLKTQPNSRLLVLAGIGHIDSRHGIPSIVDATYPVPSLTIATRLSSADNKTKDQTDITLITAEKKLIPAGKMGVMLKEDTPYVSIIHVGKDSAAEQAGIQSKDRITKINNQLISSLHDLKRITEGKPAGSKLLLTLKRGEKSTLIHTELTLK